MSPMQPSEDWIDNTRIREAVLDALRKDDELTFNEIAMRLGWIRKRGSRPGDKGQGETTQLQRRLGMKAQKSGHVPHKCTSTLIRYELAVQICRAIDRAPWELDL